VGVLTQYQPFELNQYIGNGQPWDLDRQKGGVFILPPYMKAKSGEWYKGTANAIFQNIQFIERYNPQYVLILSGDHIYKMNYENMLEAHKKTGADCTIASLTVPLSEASRFGLLITDESGKIVDFQEKPKNPKSDKASMGVYIFTWDKLRAYLTADENDKSSQNDFGKNIIPKMLTAGEKMFSFDFNGYWKDVGTISSLWEANMDLLNSSSGLNLADQNWKIYARNTAVPPHYTCEKADIKNSIISEGSVICGKVKNSVLSQSCFVDEGAEVLGSIIMPGAKVMKGAKVHYSIVGQEAVIGENAVLGKELVKLDDGSGEWDISVVGPKEIFN
jgi:glucose-1-phosphate adenylyltransferase